MSLDPIPAGAGFPEALIRLSVTRIRILQLVMSRPRTLGEMARCLDINKSAVHRHLQLLVAQNALTRADHGKWVYYRLGPGAALLLDRVLTVSASGLPIRDEAEPVGP